MEIGEIYTVGSQIHKIPMLYVQLAHIYFGSAKEHVCKETTDRQQEMKLIEAGFEYVGTDKDGVSLYRKPK